VTKNDTLSDQQVSNQISASTVQKARIAELHQVFCILVDAPEGRA
jgi:hypothetical protein